MEYIAVQYSKEIEVKLDNAEAFTALQLDIKLPMGLNLEKTTLKKATGRSPLDTLEEAFALLKNAQNSTEENKNEV